MDEDHDATPKDRSEISLKSVKPGRGRSEVSPIYLLQRARLSPNSARGASRNRAPKRTMDSALDCSYACYDVIVSNSPICARSAIAHVARAAQHVYTVYTYCWRRRELRASEIWLKPAWIRPLLVKQVVPAAARRAQCPQCPSAYSRRSRLNELSTR